MADKWILALFWWPTGLCLHILSTGQMFFVVKGIVQCSDGFDHNVASKSSKL